MAVWLCRAGRFGEYEARFFEDNKIFYTFEQIDKPLSTFATKNDLKKYFLQNSPVMKDKAASVFAGQGYVFYSEMKKGDWIVTPSKTSPGLLHFAEIIGDYIFDGNADDSYRHARPVKWFAKMQQGQFEQDIQYTFNTPMTICKIKQENRIRQVVSPASQQSTCTSFLPPPPPEFGCFVT